MAFSNLEQKILVMDPAIKQIQGWISLFYWNF